MAFYRFVMHTLQVFRRGLLVLTVLGCALPLAQVDAGGATPPAVGHLLTVTQDTFAHKLHISGWAYDPAKPTAAVAVKLYADGKYIGHVRAGSPSPNVDKTYKIHGQHAYALTATWTKTARAITAKTVAAPFTTLATKAVRHYSAAPGNRIIAVAKRYVGHARYIEGGASPKGFDCSGYTKYAYAVAKVATLPHNAEGQRAMRSMRRISASSARSGDLVFYLSGGSAYHVAIYAGHGMQYAAATPQDGIRYQAVWSRAVQYGTLTH
jgi:cell wall-associated NlpC family hydrolase